MEKKRIYTPEEKKLIKIIMNGKVYTKIERVSSSGMSRCMSFYYVNKDKRLQNITQDIHDLNGYGTITKDGYLRVGGCGMDMIFAILYGSLPYKLASKRNQRYNTLN